MDYCAQDRRRAAFADLLGADRYARFVGIDQPAEHFGRVSWYQIAADASSLQGQTVRLEFGLLRGDNGQTTFGGLDNIVPEPAAAGLLLLAALSLSRPRRR